MAKENNSPKKTTSTFLKMTKAMVSGNPKPKKKEMKNKYRPKIDARDIEVIAPIEKDAKTRNYTLTWTNTEDGRKFEQTYIMGMDYTEGMDSLVKKFKKYIFSEYDSE